MSVKAVVGDARRYEYVIALRAFETTDFLTARWAQLRYELLEKVSNRMTCGRDYLWSCKPDDGALSFVISK